MNLRQLAMGTRSALPDLLVNDLNHELNATDLWYEITGRYQLSG